MVRRTASPRECLMSIFRLAEHYRRVVDILDHQQRVSTARQKPRFDEGQREGTLRGPLMADAAADIAVGASHGA